MELLIRHVAGSRYEVVASPDGRPPYTRIAPATSQTECHRIYDDARGRPQDAPSAPIDVEVAPDTLGL